MNSGYNSSIRKSNYRVRRTQSQGRKRETSAPCRQHFGLAGWNVAVSENRLSATHGVADEFDGVVFGGEPLEPIYLNEAFADTFGPEESAVPPAHYFEVVVDEVRMEATGDGLTMGVTMALPREVPATCDLLPFSWSVGYDGYAVLSENWIPIRWRPSRLREGDHLGLLVRDGELILIHNGSLVTRLHGRVPSDVPLYPFIDFLTGTVAVSLVEGSHCEALRRHLTGINRLVTPASDLNLVFSTELAGSLVNVSNSGFTVHHASDDPDDFNGVVFFAGSFAVDLEAATYYELRVDKVRSSDCVDGLTLGITSDSPSSMYASHFESAMDIPSSWSMGYDGLRFKAEHSQNCIGPAICEDIGWRPNRLRKGDRVGIMLWRARLSIFLNGIEAARMECLIPSNRELYPFIDLMGSALVVSVVSNAVAPPKPHGPLDGIPADFEKPKPAYVSTAKFVARRSAAVKLKEKENEKTELWGDGSTADCAICLEPMKAGDLVQPMSSCKHAIHEECARDWLMRLPLEERLRAKCPLCRSSFVQRHSKAKGCNQRRRITELTQQESHPFF